MPVRSLIPLLIGLACKNAILIVEFAKTKRQEEKLTAENAALVATQLRFRPILMTSTAISKIVEGKKTISSG